MTHPSLLVVDQVAKRKYKTHMTGNLERFSGFAGDYEAARPTPPDALKDVLLALSAVKRPTLVVDIGSGTGLSTRYWADVADRVIGIEPNDDMRAQAISSNRERNVSFINAVSTHTGLPSNETVIACCSQALHWMEPEATFTEVARILRPGGVFAAYDYDWPPTTGVWEADKAYMECMDGLGLLEATESKNELVQKWDKDGHLRRMKESGRFRFVNEVVLHHVEAGDGDRFIVILLSQGGVRLLLRKGYSESDLGIDTFRSRCNELLGNAQRDWYWSSRVRIGIK